MGNLFGKVLARNVTATGTLDLVVTRGHTGRSVPVGKDYRLVEQWSKAESKEQIESHPACDRFRAEVNSVRALTGDALHCIRGRIDDGTIVDWRQMGPPTSCGQGSRYAASGVGVLYLCDSIGGVHRELNPGEGTKIFLQEYMLRSSGLRLGDLAASDLTEFVKAVFDVAENSAVEGRVGPTTFLFTQVVARIVREAGFDGMVVPGVRGTTDFKYRNVVVFDAKNRWAEWSGRDAGFRSTRIDSVV